MFGIVGNWGFTDGPKGITTYNYDQRTGEWHLIRTVRPDISAGQLCVNPENGMVYCVDEVGHQHGDLGGGGYVNAFRFEPESGELTFVNERCSLSPEPSYICLDKTGRFLVVCHCCDPFHVTKISEKNGKFFSETVYDDCALVLFRINEDGSIGEACDIAITKGAGMLHPDAQYDIDPTTNHIQLTQVISRQHSVIQSPDGEMLIVTDKGMDRIYTYRIDRENGKLIELDCFLCARKSFPRYAVFHPSANLVFVNCERAASVYAFRYDSASGKLSCIGCEPILLDQEIPGLAKPVGAQDILIHPNGKWLYVSAEVVNYICMMEILQNGSLQLRQNIHCGGEFPRGLCLSPDGKYLFSGNMHSNNITSFRIGSDGWLTPTGRAFEAVAPSAIRIFEEGQKRNMFVDR